MIIQKQDCKMDVDIEKTIEYYREHALCDCPACRNFYAQAETALTKLKEFFSELGVDISRPDETSWDVLDGIADYFFVAYTVSGKVLEYDKYEIDLQDGDLFLNVVIDDHYIPNEQKNEYFVISVYGIKLPWVLDEPLPDAKPFMKTVTEVKNSFWSKLRKILFKKAEKSNNIHQPIPSWENIVEWLYDKDLDAFRDEVTRVIYSKDKSMRYVILKDDKGYFTYQLEIIYQFNEEEWQYICKDDTTLPAMWETYRGAGGKSIFNSERELLKSLAFEPEYKKYFSGDEI